MGCETYEVGVRDSVTGQMMPRTWSSTAVEEKQNMAWLKFMNAQGNDIFIRPAGSLGLLLLDDLDAPAIARLRSDGLAPALVVETSPRNYQAWVRVSHEPVQENQATAAARILAERYGGDPNSADWRHLGRLAGFTNRKPKHAQANGMQPYVLVRDAGGAVAEQGAQLLTAAQEALAAAAAVAQRRAERPARGEARAAASRSPGEAYRYHAGRVEPVADHSRLDWRVCMAIACSTLEADQTYLEEAMLQGSPDLQERKKVYVEDYVRRTAENVLKLPEVINARERLAQKPRAHPSPVLT